MKEIKVDAMGDQCPIPVIKTKKSRIYMRKNRGPTLHN